MFSLLVLAYRALDSLYSWSGSSVPEISRSLRSPKTSAEHGGLTRILDVDATYVSIWSYEYCLTHNADDQSEAGSVTLLLLFVCTEAGLVSQICPSIRNTSVFHKCSSPIRYSPTCSASISCGEGFLGWGIRNVEHHGSRLSNIRSHGISQQDSDIRGRGTVCPQKMYHSRRFKLSWGDLPHGTVGSHLQLEGQGAYCCRSDSRFRMRGLLL